MKKEWISALFCFFTVCCVFIFVLPGCGSGGGSSDSTPVGSETGNGTGTDESTDGSQASIQNPMFLNSIVLGWDIPNVLKGIMVAVDDTKGYAYVAGIMTRNIAVVDIVGAKLIRSFRVSENTLNVAKPAFDSIHRKLWLVSGRGEYIKIVDPDGETVLADVDISNDKAPNASTYPVRSIALDPESETMYVARSDGGSRVSVFDSNGMKTGDILTGKSVQTIRWSVSEGGLFGLTAPRTGSGEILFLPNGEEEGIVAIPAPSDFGQAAPNLLAVGTNGTVYVGGSSLWKIDRTSGAELWKTPLNPNIGRIEVSGNEIGVLYKYGPDGDESDYLSRLSTYDTADGKLLGTRFAGYECSRMAQVASGGFVVGYAGNAKIGIFPKGSDSPKTVQVGTAVEDVHFTPDGTRLLMLNRLGGSQLVDLNLLTGNADIHESEITGAWPIRMALYPKGDRLFIFSHFESKLSVLRISDLSKTGEIALGQPHSLSDTLSDMAASPDGSLLACLLCEKGVVVVVDASSESVLATAQLGVVREGIGPGRMNAAVDAEHGRIFVYFADNNRLYRLDASENFQASLESSVVIEPDQQTEGAFSFKIVYYSPTLDKVIVWNRIVDPDSLTLESTLPGVQRVSDENNGFLFGERYESNGDSVLAVLDAENLMVSDSIITGNFQAMGAYLAFDFERGKFVEALSAESRVNFLELSQLSLFSETLGEQ